MKHDLTQIYTILDHNDGYHSTNLFEMILVVQKKVKISLLSWSLILMKWFISELTIFEA
jgi:hypothetical protein